MSKLVRLYFSIKAAKSVDYDERTGLSYEDWKFIDETEDGKEAMEKFHSVRDYPIVEFKTIFEFDDGTAIHSHIFGDGTVQHYKLVERIDSQTRETYKVWELEADPAV